MRKFFVLVIFCLAGIISADPYPVGLMTEFRVSPDSLERIELGFIAPDEPIGSGWSVITRAGEAMIDSSLCSNENEYLVITNTNTEGIFTLDDECDTIVVVHPYGWNDTIIYPRPCPAPVPLPPPGASASYFYQSYVGSDWYIDSTPTFGEENDDYPYCCISGGVFDEDSLPIEGAEVVATLYESYERVDTSDADGLYSFTDVYPGGYTLIATVTGYSPGTIGTSTHALCPAEKVNFYLSPLEGVEEKPISPIASLAAHPNPFVEKTVISYQLSVIGKSQGPITDHQLPITLSIYGLSGRLIKRFTIYESRFTNHEISWDGRNENGISVPPGIYFVKLQSPYGTSSTKVTRLR